MVGSIFIFKLFLLYHFFGLLCVYHLMVASLNITTSDLLQHNTSLQEQTTIRNLGRKSFHISSPEEKTRISALAVNGNEIQIVMEAGEVGADVVLL